MRAAINTPIQGSAADVATAAMLAIHACPELRDMGWRLLLQVPPRPGTPLPGTPLAAETAASALLRPAELCGCSGLRPGDLEAMFRFP